MLPPSETLMIKTIAYPKDTNSRGDIFGGWLVSQMDLAGAIAANTYVKERTATVAINNLTFIKPVFVGDVISCYVQLIKRGHTSLTLQISVWINRNQTLVQEVAQGEFVFVAVDENRKSIPINWQA